MAEKKCFVNEQRMQLSRKILATLNPQAPGDTVFALPEKVLQFGTGVLLRGLPDYFIDKANRQNIFNGRVVVIKSTNNGATDAFKQQDGLFTLVERGMEHGVRSEKVMINSSISRVLSASEEWDQVLACAADPAIQVIISNTTEVGIVLVTTDATAGKPVSFPGRLLALLEHRFLAFHGSHDAGMVIIPTELIVDNGAVLKTIVTRLAELRGLSTEFMNWLDKANDFCNSLVDRIVPGKLSVAEQAAIEKQMGYEDALMIMSETYRLWAIETNSERTRNILSFNHADTGVVLAPDINKFRELKLRLLNGTHTFSCALACLSGFITVKDAMHDSVFSDYVLRLMLQEIAPLVVQDNITIAEATDFSASVIDRFKNPYIEHQWMSISVQYTSKMMMRTIPLIEKYYRVNNAVPALMALGFAAYLLFTKPVHKDGEEYYGEHNGARYRIQDDKAAVLYAHWQSPDAVAAILKDKKLFVTDLTQYKGFAEAVQLYLASLIEQGAVRTLDSGVTKNSVA
jgi:tagaturonate reductase